MATSAKPSPFTSPTPRALEPKRDEGGPFATHMGSGWARREAGEKRAARRMGLAGLSMSDLQSGKSPRGARTRIRNP
jgi:hypothetical protein